MCCPTMTCDVCHRDTSTTCVVSVTMCCPTMTCDVSQGHYYQCGDYNHVLSYDDL
jgi:hypothetical protein